MIKKLALLCILPMFFAGQATAEIVNGTPDHVLRTIEAYYDFPGDRHGDFVGDVTVILNDQSEWKVHPDDTEKFATWYINDIVHPRVRTSSYWFKREHKFELFNHTRRDTVRAMLVKYPGNTMIVGGTQDYEVERQLKTRPMKDNNGEIVLDNNGQKVMESYWDIKFERLVFFYDGSIWSVKDHLNEFKSGKFVYLSANNQTDSISYFFIIGSEREALWTDAVRRY